MGAKMKTKLSGLIAIFVLLFVGTANATLMDLFEGPDSGNSSFTNNGMTIDLIGDSRWSSDSSSTGKTNSCCTLDEGWEFSLVDGSLFVADSFLYQHGHSGEFTIWDGLLNNVVVTSQLFNSFYSDGPSFQTIALSSFAGVQIDRLRVRNGEGDDIGIAGLNFTRTSVVPAPATLALFGLGLAGLGWSRRKKA
tara:strand:+ start:403 stop:981 length:579 start_codon:yes stop_codon:yes gene_type:complete